MEPCTKEYRMCTNHDLKLTLDKAMNRIDELESSIAHLNGSIVNLSGPVGLLAVQMAQLINEKKADYMKKVQDDLGYISLLQDVKEDMRQTTTKLAILEDQIIVLTGKVDQICLAK